MLGEQRAPFSKKVSKLPPADPSLTSKHSIQRDPITITPPSSGLATPVPPDSDLLKLISSRLRNGASPGPSSWTGELIATIAEDTDCLAGIAALTQDILNGRLDERAKPYILGSYLITVPKKNGSLRFIAIGEAFYKLAGLFGLAPLDENIRKSLPSWQLGVAVPGGAELGATTIQFLLEDTSMKYAGISCDLENAFNSRSRTAILSALYACPRLKSIWKISHWTYSTPSPL